MPDSTRRAPRASAPPPTVEVGPPAEPAGAPPLEPERRSLFRRDSARPATRPKAQAQPPVRGEEKEKPASWPWIDVVLAAAVAVVAAFTTTMPEGPLRLGFGLAMLLFVPGYLLLQAFAVPVPPGKARLWQALGSLGISPALVGVLALMTSIVEGGFSRGAVIILVTAACLGFAAAAIVRRRALAHAALRPADAPKAAPSAATAKSGLSRP